jgi:hypothetical protein
MKIRHPFRTLTLLAVFGILANGKIGRQRRIADAAHVIPLYCAAYSYLQKPLVRGLSMNSGNLPLFKYAWIDTNWRPS